MNYLELALDKKSYKVGIKHILRREFDAVATDGYRLHRQVGLDKTVPHFIGSTVSISEAPDYDVVLNEASNPVPLFDLKLDKETLQRFQTLIKLRKFGKPVATFTWKTEKLLQVDIVLKDITISLPLEVLKTHKEFKADELVFKVDFAFFVDALVAETSIQVSLAKQHMIVINHSTKGNNYQAIVMACRS